ncbi:Fc.00g054350.m01.CDS01 [Cosmosporella sp. VM-42]
MVEKEKTTHFLEGKTIIVAGGGVAGSAFAIGLRRLWDPASKPPTVHIYDRDPEDVAARREGYSLSLAGYDDSGGLLALRNLGLFDEILAKAVSGVEGSGAFKIWGPDWREHISFRHKPIANLPTSSIRITRKDLRSILHDALGPGDSIQWGARCISAKRLDDGRVRVEIARGPPESETITEEDGDILIAADGASSKIREYLRPDDNLDFAGAILRGGLSRFEGALPKPLDEDWGFMLSGTGVSCFFSPVDKHSIMWGVGHLEDTQVPPLNLDSAEDVKAVIQQGLDLGSELQEPFRAIVEHTDPRTVLSLNARDKVPFSHDRVDRLPVIFIGDSNHAVSPFAGYGANLALSDAWDLAEQLCNGHSLKDSVSEYDKLAVPRATKILKGSRSRLKAGHSTGLQYWVFWLMLVVGKFVGWVMGKKVT